MSFEIVVTQLFRKHVEALQKKYRSLGDDLKLLVESLQEKPQQGIEIRPNCYKIRLAIRSKGKGKSAGARVITYVHVDAEDIYFLAIYDKAEQDTISERELDDLLAGIK
jgi:mRNA-degrading endonuclease RelE of RelBE toxin-antitoxin system